MVLFCVGNYVIMEYQYKDMVSMKENQTPELANSLLLDFYWQWSHRIDESLFGVEFSNPYYIKTPSDWWEKKHRIMIVGEEGAGTCGAGKREFSSGDENWNPRTELGINKIMDYNGSETHDQTAERNSCRKGLFWSRIRKIYDLDKNISIVWNNIDKIHRLGNSGKECRLTPKQRTLLHQAKVLGTEIEILKPTIIVFFGWHWLSLEKEIPEDIYTDVYRRYTGHESEPILLNNMVFSLHPNDRTYGGCTKVYEEKVLGRVRSLLNH